MLGWGHWLSRSRVRSLIMVTVPESASTLHIGSLWASSSPIALAHSELSALLENSVTSVRVTWLCSNLYFMMILEIFNILMSDFISHTPYSQDHYGFMYLLMCVLWMHRFSYSYIVTVILINFLFTRRADWPISLVFHPETELMSRFFIVHTYDMF